MEASRNSLIVCPVFAVSRNRGCWTSRLVSQVSIASGAISISIFRTFIYFSTFMQILPPILHFTVVYRTQYTYVKLFILTVRKQFIDFYFQSVLEYCSFINHEKFHCFLFKNFHRWFNCTIEVFHFSLFHDFNSIEFDENFLEKCSTTLQDPLWVVESCRYFQTSLKSFRILFNVTDFLHSIYYRLISLNTIRN